MSQSNEHRFHIIPFINKYHVFWLVNYSVPPTHVTNGYLEKKVNIKQKIQFAAEINFEQKESNLLSATQYNFHPLEVSGRHKPQLLLGEYVLTLEALNILKNP